MRTMRLLRYSEVSRADWEKVEVVTNRPLVALNRSSKLKKSRTAPGPTGLPAPYRLAWT